MVRVHFNCLLYPSTLISCVLHSARHHNQRQPEDHEACMISAASQCMHHRPMRRSLRPCHSSPLISPHLHPLHLQAHFTSIQSSPFRFRFVPIAPIQNQMYFFFHFGFTHHTYRNAFLKNLLCFRTLTTLLRFQFAVFYPTTSLCF
jgi:hypothetical protein